MRLSQLATRCVPLPLGEPGAVDGGCRKATMLKQRIATAGVGVLVGAMLVAGFPTVATAAEGDPPTPITYPISDLVQAPSSYPSQTQLPTVPDDPNDASIDRGAVPYAEVANRVNALMADSDLISAQVVGNSVQGRDIQLVTVTSPETAEQTAQQLAWKEQIKHEPATAAADQELLDGYKIPIWFNGNIHGNEWEGADIILNYIEALVTSDDPVVAEMLENYRFYFTVTNNPDGRVNGTRANADGFDANRDMITGVTPEARVIRDLAGIIQPTFYVDLHGYTGVLQVEPCGPPHGENYEYDLFLPHAYAAALAIEDAVVEADIEGNTYLAEDGSVTTENTGKIKIPYRDIRSGWDDWPPLFTPQFLAYQGAVTNTVELPHGRSGDQPRNTAINNEVGRVTVESAVSYFDENSQALLKNQIEIFSRGDAGEPLKTIPANPSPADYPGIPHEWIEIWNEADVYGAEFPRAYVIPVDDQQRSATDAARLVDQLIANGVEVSLATTPITAGDTTYPAGSYVVDMHQPLRGMANVLLADGSDITERVPDMYDMSAWSLALLWGADVFAIGATQDASLDGVTLEAVTEALPTGTAPADASYLELATAGAAEYQAINVLLNQGIAVSAFEDGSVIIANDGASKAAAAAVANDYGVQFTASTGVRLLTENSTALKSLRVAYSGNQDDRVTLQRLGFTNLQHVNAASLAENPALLDDTDVLWVGGSLVFDETQAAGRDAVAQFIEAGNGVAGKGPAVADFANAFGLTEVTAATGVRSSNGIVRVEDAEGGLLSTYSQDTAFVAPATWYTGLGDNATVEQSYASDDVLISGHWANEPGAGREDAAGQASVVSATAESGTELVMFGTSVNYRTHPVGSYPWIARALVSVNAHEGTPVSVELAVEHLTDETRGEVDAPDEVTIGEAFTVAIGGIEDGTEVQLQLFGDGSELVTADVVDGAVSGVVIPEGTEPGEFRIAATDTSDGSLIGWDDTTAVTADVPTDPTDPTDPTHPADPGQPSEPGDGGEGDLPVTGTTLTIGALVIALLLAAGGTALVLHRKRATQEAAQQ